MNLKIIWCMIRGLWWTLIGHLTGDNTIWDGHRWIEREICGSCGGRLVYKELGKRG